jgi:hypothetical protein
MPLAAIPRGARDTNHYRSGVMWFFPDPRHAYYL